MNHIFKLFSVLVFLMLITGLKCQYENNLTPAETTVSNNSSTPDESSEDSGVIGTGQIFDISIDNTVINSTSENLMTGNEIASSKDSLRSIAGNIPDPENAFFTDTGRLFFTGGPSLYELTAENSAIRLLYDSYGIFGGIAQHGKWLYVIYAKIYTTMTAIDLSEIIKTGSFYKLIQTLNNTLIEKGLYRADLSVSPEKMVFEKVFALNNMFLCNGMAADNDGNLYITDNTFLPLGQIIKLIIKNENSVPDITREIWLSYKTGAYSPNGIVIHENNLYFTDFLITSSKQARVKKVPIINGKAGTPEIIYSVTGFFDDLDTGTYRGTPVIAVASYLDNSVLLINENDRSVIKLASGEVSSPSSVHFGKGKLFKSNELIVTEKGILYDYYSGIGNKLSCLSLPE